MKVNKAKIRMGEPLQITYSLDNQGSSYRQPAFKNFDVISRTSQSSNSKYINGRSSFSHNFSFNIKPKKIGRYQLPAATVRSNGKTITSNRVWVDVLKADAKIAGQNKSTNKNILIRIELNKRKAYLGEEVLGSLKLYTRVRELSLETIEIPEFDEFWSEQVEVKNVALANNTVTIGGIEYRHATIGSFVLYPQRSGKIKIGNAKAVINTRERAKSDPYDPFGFFGRYKTVKHEIKSPSVTLEVMPLPSGKPDDFAGISGKFNLKAKIDKESVKSNEAVNLTITISGKGNLNIIEPPKINFPPDLEVYDPKIKEHISVKASGVTGSKKYEYVIIPRYGGNYKFGPISFSYFDPKTKKYVTRSSPVFNLEVEKGKGEETRLGGSTTTSKERIQIIGSDIRFIKTVDTDLVEKGSYFYKSGLFYSLVFVPILLFIGFLSYYLKTKESRKDKVSIRMKKAGKIASKKLINAQTHLKNNDRGGFYEEISNALIGYISDKLNIPTSEFSNDHVTAQLIEKGANPEVAEKTKGILGKCEFARFSPSNNGNEMQNDYNAAVDIIEKIEEEIK